MKEAEKLLNEKTKKGYTNVSVKSSSATEDGTKMNTSTKNIMALLKSDSIEDVKEGLIQFSRYLETNSSDDNRIHRLFGLKKKEPGKIVTIKAMTDLLKKHEPLLDSDPLVLIIHSFLQDIQENFQIVLDAIQLLIQRKDVNGQNAVVEIFKKACAFYDAGHRFDESTVQDQLIEDLFPMFEGEPLVNLLTWCKSDYLLSDRMDALFRPAFERIRDKKLEKKLLDHFEQYIEECDEVYKKSGILERYDKASDKVKKTIIQLKDRVINLESGDSLAKRRFESSHKFWEIEEKKRSLEITYGWIGKTGIAEIINFNTSAECHEQAKKLIAERGESRFRYEESHLKNEKEVTKLIAMMEGANSQKQYEATCMVWRFDDLRVIPALIKAMDYSMGVAREAMHGLGHHLAIEAAPQLIAKLHSQLPQHIAAAARALSQINNEGSKIALADKDNYAFALKKAFERIDGVNTIRALQYFNNPAVNDNLLSLLIKSEDQNVRRDAKHGLAYRIAEEKIAHYAEGVLSGSDKEYTGRELIELIIGITANVKSPSKSVISAMAQLFNEASTESMEAISRGAESAVNDVYLLPPEEQRNVYAWRDALCVEINTEKRSTLISNFFSLEYRKLKRRERFASL